jgi:two-component system, cell cycle sensor histidine kinase and response regulator CckA
MPSKTSSARRLRWVASGGALLGLSAAVVGLWVVVQLAFFEGATLRDEHYLLLMCLLLAAFLILTLIGTWLYRQMQRALAALEELRETDRKKAEGELVASENRLRLLMSQMPAAIWTTDHDLRFTFTRGGNMTDAPDSQLGPTGPSLYDYFGTRDPNLPAIAAHLKALAGEHARYEVEWRSRTYETHVEPLTDAGGQIIGAIGVALDITERQQAEHRLRASEERYRAIAEVSPAGIWHVSPDGHTIYANPAMLAMLELENQDDLKGQTMHGFFTEAGQTEIAHAFELRRRGLPSIYEVELLGRRGRRANVLIAGVPLFDRSGRLHSLIGTFTDISERKKMEQSLRESEERYRAIFETNPFPIYLFDCDTLMFLAVNNAAVLHYGYSVSEFMHMSLLDLRLPADREAIRAEAQEGRPAAVRGLLGKHVKKDGTVIDVELSTHDLLFGGRRARLVVAVNVTERLQLEAQLRQAQKMEAVGRLAGGVAHDFNNVLTVIVGYSDLVARQIGQAHPVTRDVEIIHNAAQRAKALTSQLLAFSRKNDVAPKVLDLNVVAVDVERLLQRLIGEDVELVTKLAPEPAWIFADAGQLEQVIVNLVVNARDAMPGGGKVEVAVMHVEVGPDEARRCPPLKAGWHVLLTVTDTGAGMPEDVRSHLFEPFFTTKEQGKGTGLGLFTVYGSVHRHQGQIAIASEPGKGTAVSIRLPCAPAPAAVPPANGVQIAPAGKAETVLLVEDEPVLRSMLLRVLEERGYRVLHAPDGETALKLGEAHPGQIDLLVTDLVMPRLGGRELAERMGGKRPNMKILYISGYTDGVLNDRSRDGIGYQFLQKPFLPSALAAKVREVLEA